MGSKYYRHWASQQIKGVHVGYICAILMLLLNRKKWEIIQNTFTSLNLGA